MRHVSTLPKPITDYQQLSAEELFRRTAEAKRALGDRVMILGHNYQRDEVIEHADFRGDSLLLSKLAAERSERPYIVFCGVHFMAETADILSRSNQTVILPDMAAGCSMADMAAIEQVDQCWETLGRILAGGRDRHAGGLCEFCRGAQSLLRRTWRDYLYVLQREGGDGMVLGQARENSLFPGRASWAAIRPTRWGCREKQMIVWDPYQPNGGNTREAIQRAKLILWKGPLQRASDVPAGACGQFPQAVSGREGDRPSGMS